jgi:hypothetical protein
MSTAELQVVAEVENPDAAEEDIVTDPNIVQSCLPKHADYTQIITTDEDLLQKTMSPATRSPSPELEVEEVNLPEPRDPEVPAMEDF